MASVIFEDRAVAFIDIIGFSALVNKAANDEESRQKLESLVSLLESAVPVLDNGVSSQVPKHLIPKFFYVSDSLILSAPLNDTAMNSYRGLEIIVMRVIQLTHRFLDAGYLVRGGISIGRVWHSDSNIVGPAYQEAFELERSVNNPNPCIILSESACKVWAKGYGNSTRMCINSENRLIVNGLHEYYVVDKSHGGIERTYARYRGICENNIKAAPNNSAQMKWKWFLEYLESEASENKKWPSYI